MTSLFITIARSLIFFVFVICYIDYRRIEELYGRVFISLYEFVIFSNDFKTLRLNSLKNMNDADETRILEMKRNEKTKEFL